MERMRFFRYVLVGLLLIGVPGAHAQPGKDSVAFRLGMELLDALNSGDKSSQLDYLTKNLDADALQKTPAADRLNMLVSLYDKTGGFELASTPPMPTPPGVAVLTLRSKRGDYWLNLRVLRSGQDNKKLLGYFFVHQEDPKAATAAPWPSGQLTEPAIVKEIEQHVDLAVKGGRFSGVVLIAKDDTVLLKKAYGLANVAAGTPNNTDTKFNLGSMNKMFTSVAIAQLVEAGKLSYTDTLASVLPDYPNKEAARKITIRQLLTHTAGLGDFFTPEFFQHRDNYKSLRSYLPLFANAPLLFEPGTGGSYSNAGFIVLGLIIEKVSGENYFDYVKEHIFQPVGMINTDFYERDATVPNLAYGYTYDDLTDPLHINLRLLNTPFLPAKGSSAGGGYSTADDLLKFSHALLGHRLLGAALTDTITTGKVSSPRGPEFQYGYGFNVQTGFLGRHIIGHGGGSRGINGTLSMIPANGYSVIVLANYDPPAADGMAKEIADFLVRQKAVPYYFGIPEGWRAEMVELPPPFAPQVTLKGIDDLRFPRGWREPASDEYWSFGYLLWLDAGQQIDTAVLQDNLKIYYEGLVARAVARDHIPADKLVPVRVSLHKINAAADDRETCAGTVEMLDYMAQKPMVLYCLVHIRNTCTAQNHVPVFFELSPKPVDQPIWKVLETIRSGFECGGSQLPTHSGRLPGAVKGRIDRLFQAFAKPGSPGYAIGIIRDTQVLYVQGYGSANLDYELRITPHSAFDIASVSKQFTAACVALLIMDGKLSLESPASLFIPQLAKYPDTIRVKHLIYNTSGIIDYYKLPRPGGRSWNTLFYFDNDVCIAASLGQDNLLFKPGEKWDYCNVNYMLLAKIVEKISGETFRSFSRHRLFAPLGMTNTRINDDATEIIRNRVTPYNPRTKDYIDAYAKDGITVDSGGPWLQHPRNSPHYGGSGVVTTVDDLLAWSRNFFTGKFGGREFYDLMHRTEKFPDGRDNQAFGLYWDVYKDRRLVAWDGGDFGISSQLIRFPDQKLAIVVLSNLGPGEAYKKANEIADILIGSGDL
jgi:CubicO group peptidase (beta-lactamase class C family)